MRKKVFSGVFALAFLATAGWGVNKSMSNDAGLSDLALSNVEALAGNENGSGYNCGYACYEWDDDWYEDTKHFTLCKRGCPEGSGTSPKYIFCD